MRKIALLALLLAIGTVYAQTPQEEYEAWKKQAMGDYGRFRQQQIDEYQNFRKKANEEYAEFVRSAWATVGKKPPEQREKEPKPPQPIVAPKQEEPRQPEPIPYKEIVPLPDVSPVPDVPIPVPQNPVGTTLHIRYFGMDVQVRKPQRAPIQLLSTKPDDIAQAWLAMSNGNCEELLADCLGIKNKLQLNDWGYILLLQRVAAGVAGEKEAPLMMHWLLAQSGYSSRLAETKKGRLEILLSFDVKVFEYAYVDLDGTFFFLLDDSGDDSDEIDVLDHSFPNEHTASLRMLTHPRLAHQSCPQRTFRSQMPPAWSLPVSVNKNLIDYFNAYPHIAANWDIYANASLSEPVKEQLYPILRKKMENLDEVNSAQALLQWIQTGFEYQTDGEQFGNERSLFADETLFYPYCDCEDRSILFSILVRDLLGLDVVLLHFPGHMATAVAFSKNVDGDYLELDGRRYIVCDPTYIGAPVGMAMPECKSQEVNVYRLSKL